MEVKSKYYLVDSSLLPDIFIKVMNAKELLQTGEVKTAAEAAAKAGISRSAYYKYKDGIRSFQDLKTGRILTFHVMLRDEPGSLSTVLEVFAQCGANILTINQSIPVNGAATVTVSAEIGSMTVATDEMLSRLEALDTVMRAEILAG